MVTPPPHWIMHVDTCESQEKQERRSLLVPIKREVEHNKLQDERKRVILHTHYTCVRQHFRKLKKFAVSR